MQTTVSLTRISFPELQLRQRQAHQLRGYLGNMFKEYSPLLHNHYSNGSLRYRYPLVQYKIVHSKPILFGLAEGSEMLQQLFMQIKELKLGDQCYTIHTKNVEHSRATIGLSDKLHTYRFGSLWLALNQQNWQKYKQLSNSHQQKEMLESVAVANVLSVFRNLGLELPPEQRVLVQLPRLQTRTTFFKEQKMIGFRGPLITNALLPAYTGLGKSVSRGFGTLLSIDDTPTQ